MHLQHHSFVDAIYRQISRPIQWWHQETKFGWAKLSIWQVYECKPIVGIWGLCLQQGPGTEPWPESQGDEAIQTMGKMVQFEVDMKGIMRSSLFHSF